MLITSLVSTDQPLTRRIHVETVHCSSFIIQHDFSLLILFAFTGNNSLLNYLGLRKKANECLFEWNRAPFGTAIKQSATHTKHICCGLTTDVSQVIQSIVIEGNDERLFGLHIKSASALTILCVPVFVSIACVYFLKKFSSSLAEWSWPHFIDTLKANRILLPLYVAEKMLFCFDNQTGYKTSW